jgi:V/A-type H+-transporting ATPase subunit G/H
MWYVAGACSVLAVCHVESRRSLYLCSYAKQALVSYTDMMFSSDKSLSYKAGEYMPLEAIKAVAAAETEAENLRIEALAEAKKIIAAAEVSGREEVQRAMKSAESKIQDLCREAEDHGKASAAKSLEEARDKCLFLEKESEKRMDKAVAIIVERVVNGQ